LQLPHLGIAINVWLALNKTSALVVGTCGNYNIIKLDMPAATRTSIAITTVQARVSLLNDGT